MAFDVETTGLFPGIDRIIELAGVAFDGPAVIGSFQQLVDPEVPIPPEAARVNGITDEMVRGCPGIGSALPSFLDFLRTGTPVAHNAAFDVGFVTADLRRAGLAPPEGPVLDTRGLARRAFPARISYSLSNLVRDLRLEQPAHRALADAHACRALFLECVKHLGHELSLDQLVCLSGCPLDFRSHAPRQVDTLIALSDALRSGEDLRIEYRSSCGELTERTIRPLSFTMAGGAGAVVAWCQLRGEKRTFLLESIVRIQPVS